MSPEPLSRALVDWALCANPMRRKQDSFWNDWAPLAALGLLAALGDVCAQIQIANALFHDAHVLYFGDVCAQIQIANALSDGHHVTIHGLYLGDVCAQIQIANALLDGDHVYRRSHLLPLI